MAYLQVGDCKSCSIVWTWLTASSVASSLYMLYQWSQPDSRCSQNQNPIFLSQFDHPWSFYISGGHAKVGGGEVGQEQLSRYSYILPMVHEVGRPLYDIVYGYGYV